MGISILAPTRGATTPWLARKKLERHFNPRSREESDDEYEQYTLFSVAFQSTLPRGERHRRQRSYPVHSYFNPRSREGSDPLFFCVVIPQCKFQSTLPRGERHTSSYSSSVSPGFQSTLPRGERQQLRFGQQWINDFNPRSREGSD